MTFSIIHPKGRSTQVFFRVDLSSYSSNIFTLNGDPDGELGPAGELGVIGTLGVK